jgi:hypothetical protein
MTLKTLLAAILLALTAATSGWAKQPTPTPTPAAQVIVQPSAWQENYNDGAAGQIPLAPWPQPMQLISGGVQTPPFPDVSSGLYFNYLLAKVPANISALHQLVIDIGVTATPGTVFNYYKGATNTCGQPPASATPMLWGYNRKNIWADGFRWWPGRNAATSYVMSPGRITLTIPLDPAIWGGVFGETAVGNPNWNATLSNIYAFGIVFGGGCFDGHGVDTSGPGPGQLQVYSFEVN